MKKSFIIALATVAIMASCSKENVIDSDNNQKSNLIGFNTYKTVTRGNPVNDKPEFQTKDNKFGVTSFISTSDKPYMGTTSEGVGIVSDGFKWNYAIASEMAYWPTGSETLDFYAYYPYGHTSITRKVFSKASGITFQYAVPATEAEQVDVMFASAKDQTKPKTSNAVQLPFKHALTQVHFKVATKTERLKVDVKKNGIVINNIHSVADFTLPTEDSDNGWKNWATPANYTVTSDEISAAGFVGLGTDSSPYKWTAVGEADKALMLIPQVVKPWEPAENAVNPEADETGAYLTVSCRIYQMLADGKTKVYLVGSEEEFGTVYVPFSSKKESTEVWNRSKKVTYNLLIGGGTTLYPIEFDPSVEDWVDADGGQIENK